MPTAIQLRPSRSRLIKQLLRWGGVSLGLILIASSLVYYLRSERELKGKAPAAHVTAVSNSAFEIPVGNGIPGASEDPRIAAREASWKKELAQAQQLNQQLLAKLEEAHETSREKPREKSSKDQSPAREHQTGSRTERSEKAQAKTPTSAPGFQTLSPSPREEGTVHTNEHRLKVGTSLSGTIRPAINSKAMGGLILRVTIPVTDSATMTIPLIPVGSEVWFEPIKVQTVLGDTHLQYAATLLTLPDSKEVDIKADATEPIGIPGLTGDVDNHYWQIAFASIFGASLKGSIEIVAQQVAGVGGQAISQVGGDLSRPLKPYANMSPTISRKHGTRGHAVLNRAITLPAWRRS